MFSATFIFLLGAYVGAGFFSASLVWSRDMGRRVVERSPVSVIDFAVLVFAFVLWPALISYFTDAVQKTAPREAADLGEAVAGKAKRPEPAGWTGRRRDDPPMPPA